MIARVAFASQIKSDAQTHKVKLSVSLIGSNGGTITILLMIQILKPARFRVLGLSRMAYSIREKGDEAQQSCILMGSSDAGGEGRSRGRMGIKTKALCVR